MSRRRGRIASATAATSAALALAALASTGCFLDGGEDDDGPPRRTTVAGVTLHPLPSPLIRACKEAQRRARVEILCPSVLPRQVRDLSGSSALPTQVPLHNAMLDRRNRPAGMNFGYSGETDDPRARRPDRFLHFEVLRADEPLPPGLRRARLGGRQGRLAAASGRPYGDETYWANHLRFFWTQGGTRYAASLHDFGRDTERVLSALIAGLRPADELVEVPAADGVETIRVPVHGPVSLALAGGRLWVGGQGDLSGPPPGESSRPAVVAIDLDTRAVAGKPTQLHFGAGAVAIDNGGELLWVVHRAAEERWALRLLDPGTGRPLGGLRGRGQGVGVAIGPDASWLLDFGTRRVRRVDTQGRRVLAEIPVGKAPAAVAAGAGGVWVTNEQDDTLTRIHPRTDRVLATIPVGDGPHGVAVAGRHVWVANAGDDSVSRIDPARNAVVATVRVGRRPRGIAASAGAVWVTNEASDSVSRIDPRRNRVTRSVRVGAGPAGIEVGDGAVWVANSLDQSVSRFEP